MFCAGACWVELNWTAWLPLCACTVDGNVTKPDSWRVVQNGSSAGPSKSSLKETGSARKALAWRLMTRAAASTQRQKTSGHRRMSVLLEGFRCGGLPAPRVLVEPGKVVDSHSVPHEPTLTGGEGNLSPPELTGAATPAVTGRRSFCERFFRKEV